MKFWYRKNLLSLVLWPLSLIWQSTMTLRHTLYRLNILTTTSFPVPIVVVGNLSVGGNGKTPLILALTECLLDLGFKPGIVSRGYGGQFKTGVLLVNPDSDAHLVGDEALLLARRLACPVAIGAKRVEAVEMLLADHDCNIILSDDGLQHLAMGRNMEIIVVNGVRGFGNGFCLPAGPLRESLSRLKTTPWVVYNSESDIHEQRFFLEPQCFRSVFNPQVTKPLNAFVQKDVTIVSAIGYPQGFLDTLQALGIQGASHFFRDHHAYTWQDLAPYEHKTVLMTEKDAVKCTHFPLKDAWYLEVKTVLSEVLISRLKEAFVELKADCNRAATVRER